MASMTDSKLKIKPLGARVVLKREETETVQGGIILPSASQTKQEVAVVVALGPGSKDDKGALIPMPVKLNDRVLIEKYTGQEVTFEDEEYIVVKADDIIAVIEA